MSESILERLEKLLKLISETDKASNNFGSKLEEMDYVEELINKIKNFNRVKLTVNEMKECNKLWKKY
tara:strand:- start:515 stop:715 length:201 start_codon:yes stop_codon:yes gene_type:complete